MNLKTEQRRLFELLCKEAACFVRVCDHDGALWASDLPRKISITPAMTEAWACEGFSVKTDSDVDLLLIDWTDERWERELSALPETAPAMPEDEQFHEAYALCRLLLRHPLQRTEEQLSFLRRTVKLTACQPARLLRSVRALHEECAAMCRRGEEVPSDAGRVLASWLETNAYDKEKQS